MKATVFIFLLGVASLSAEVRIDDTLSVDGFSSSPLDVMKMNSTTTTTITITPIPVFSEFHLPENLQTPEFQESALEFHVPSGLLDRELIQSLLPDVQFPTCG
ncbi:MAG: hypothetical protein ACAH89_06025 [Rariglobus sp.]